MSAIIGMVVRNVMLSLGSIVVGSSFAAGKITIDDWSTLIEPTVGFVLAVLSVAWKFYIRWKRAAGTATGLPTVLK